MRKRAPGGEPRGLVRVPDGEVSGSGASRQNRKPTEKVKVEARERGEVVVRLDRLAHECGLHERGAVEHVEQDPGEELRVLDADLASPAQ